jgi:predicted transcriptional regulator
LKKQTNKPSELEMQVLAVLWDNGPCTVRQVLDLLPDGKTRAYTTVLSVMQMMEKKGLVTHERQGNANLYRPLQNRKAIIKPFIGRLINNVFGGSKLRLVESLLGSEKMDAKELSELRKLIRQYTGEK